MTKSSDKPVEVVDPDKFDEMAANGEIVDVQPDGALDENRDLSNPNIPEDDGTVIAEVLPEEEPVSPGSEYDEVIESPTHVGPFAESIEDPDALVAAQNKAAKEKAEELANSEE